MKNLHDKHYFLNDIIQVSLKQVKSKKPTKLIDNPILFHGVNKSGSLTLAHILKWSYKNSGFLDERYMCRYMGLPNTKDLAINRMKNDNNRNQLLIDHGLIGLEKINPKIKVITILRNPVKRIISCYYWLNLKHPEIIMGRDIISWIKMEAIKYTTVRQFAFNHSDKKEISKIRTMPLSDQVQRANNYFEKNIAWFGITEMFEESIITLCYELGLGTIVPWELDPRNINRPKSDDIPENIYNLIESLIGHDIEFYETMKLKFEEYLKSFDFSDTLKKYKDVCPKK